MIPLEDLRVYQLSIDIAEKVWVLVNSWNEFQKKTIGSQLVRSADSIAANISEGYGRFHYKENINFNYYARGSLFETTTWIAKAKNRNMLSKAVYEELKLELNQLIKMLNKYIQSIREKAGK